MTSDELTSPCDFTIDENYLRKLLEEMIEINSIVGNEQPLAIFLAQELQALGLAIQLEDVEKNRPNVYAHHQFDLKGKTITFNGHLDTVDVCQGWSEDPFIPLEKNGKLFGLGSLDMKAGLACELAAIKALLDSSEKLSGTIHFAAVIDEEGYGLGAHKLLENPFFGRGRTKGVLIAEPFFGHTEKFSLPLGMTGKILYKITFTGKSAHAFLPRGINAITDAAKFVSNLTSNDTLNNSKPSLILPQDDEFGQGNLCVLKIAGGYRKYSVVVPDSCEIILNRLLVPGETEESARKDLDEFLSRLQLESSHSIEIVPPFYLPYRISRDEPLLQALETSYQTILNKKPLVGYRTMITDANTITGKGNIPTVLFGPTGGNIHAADEYVNLDSLVPVAQVYAQTYLEYQKIS
ncbi:MAG: M20 family metallopeptidase [Candidatus Heimdallarchaeota archaeon]